MSRHALFIVTVLSTAIAAPGLAGLSGCASAPAIQSESSSSYQQVDAETAKKMMDEEEDYAILDARTQAEYDQGHIPGAILMPHDTVADAAEDALPDKDQLILVYCRSGNRSKQASQTLADLGYTNVVEFGGINSWPYDVER